MNENKEKDEIDEPVNKIIEKNPEPVEKLAEEAIVEHITRTRKPTKIIKKAKSPAKPDKLPKPDPNDHLHHGRMLMTPDGVKPLKIQNKDADRYDVVTIVAH